jgi:putative DNA primase/helicase
MTSAVIFRVIEQEGCGLLIDEFDTMKAGSERAEEIRGLLNSGWKRAGAYVPRVEKAGDNFVVKKFSTWAPIAVAAIGRLPDTLADRSIAIVMKRKSPKRKVERLIRRNKWAYQTAAETARKIQRWANDNRATLAVAKPALPDDIDDRAMNNWEILLAIADLAGGDWPILARRAAVKLSSGRDDAGSLGEMLIVDIRKIFATRLKLDPAFDRIASVELCAALADMEARPWAEFGRARKPISQPQLARQLSNFGIASATIRIGNDTPKGYYVKAFEDVFSSYSSENPHPNRHNATTVGGVGESGDFQGATEAECGGTKNGTKPHGENECGTVADRNGEIRGAQETKEMTDSDEEGF